MKDATQINLTKDFYAVIPAGGSGTRLWPLSRASAPKFLVDLTSCGSSLLQNTVRRLQSLTDTRIMIVTGESHIDAVQGQLPRFDPTQFIVEPSGRDSMAAIGLAAAVLQKRHGNVVVGSFAADHVIRDEDAFRHAVVAAIGAAHAGKIVTIGIEPTYPATGFGYIHRGEQTRSEVYDVVEFTEKPELDRATRFVDSGEYLWNAGMFVFKTDVLLQSLQDFEPELFRRIMILAEAWDTPKQGQAMDEHWANLKKIAIDHAIAEPLSMRGGVAVVPVDMGWSDVGDYRSLGELHANAKAQVAPGGVPHPVVTERSPRSLIYTHSKPIVVLGIDDAVVVETDDVIFVTTKESSQGVKDVVETLPEELR
ncbi:mannose-1-phosphate guanylyltransferase [Arcanobacterium ihumii]|uniref:mannose-1-phosphate guanylyltransferase n=1 Tax=Arcanobacterium ihumii TaxID=2138162 RepID=UPI001F40C609|nr:mannose-1-phosphate guanylyltransferase [Arcanobacterium ihumii]